jgi:hypothetical protein
MAAVLTTTSGILFDKVNKTSQNVTLIGASSLTGLGVGGGPITGGGAPPTGEPPHPAHPIVIPPEIWPNPPEGIAPIPEHPIVLPPPDGSPPNTPAFEVHVLWSESTGWVVLLEPQFPTPTPSKR